MADPHVCARCAEDGPTCCRLVPGQEELCFPLAEVEVARILELRPDAGFLARSRNSAAFVDNLRTLFPREAERLGALFPPGREHSRLATGPDGACVLLGPAGCLLPREARPYYCRIFPFWVQGGGLSLFAAEVCLARREAASRADLFRLLGCREAELRLLHGRLRLAWGLEPAEEPSPLSDIFNRIRS